MSKKVKYDIGLVVSAQIVTAGPPIGTTLGPKGVALGLFVKAINEATASYDKGAPVRINLKIFDDKSFEFTILGYSTRYLILQEAGVEKGAQKPGRENIGKINRAQIEKIARTQLGSLNTDNLRDAIYTIEGTAKSMGIEIA